MAQRGAHIVFPHHEHDAQTGRNVGVDQIHERVERIFAGGAGNLIEPAPLIGRQLRLVEGRDENAGGTTGPQVLVFPTRIRTQHIRLDAQTSRGIGEAREQRLASHLRAPTQARLESSRLEAAV